MKNLNLSIILKGIDQASGPIRRINGELARVRAPAANLRAELGRLANLSGLTATGSALAGVGREVGSLGLKLSALAGVGGFLFKSQLIDTAAQFEKFRAILETIEGSSAKAQSSLDWVSNFAATTPFEIGEVTDSFVKLRAYGLEPTGGLLKSLGDTSAAMGKPLIMAVEAIADAITGENERLKEFGITASVNAKKNTVAYSWIQNGKTITKTVARGNKAVIASTLQAIWNSKYAGAMDKQSRTWNGMSSNLRDQWTRVKISIMEAGLFDWMKGKLGSLLETVDRMAADGSLQRWASDVGSKIKDGFVAAYDGAKRFVDFLQPIAEKVGGWGDLIKDVLLALAAIMAGPLLLAVTNLTIAFGSMSAVLLANPIVATIAAITAAVYALAAALEYVIKNWGRFTGWTDGVQDKLNSFLGIKPLPVVANVAPALRQPVAPVAPAAASNFKVPELLSAAPTLSPSLGAPVKTGFGRAESPSRTEPFKGEMKIELEDNRARVKSLKTSDPRFNFDVDTGLMFAAP